MSVLRKALPVTLAVVAGIANGFYIYEPYLNKEKAANNAALPSNADSTQPQTAGPTTTVKPEGGGGEKGQAS